MEIKSLKIKAACVSAAVTCLLFMSGMFVILTPIPVFFISSVYGKRVMKVSILLSILSISIVYLFIFPLALNGIEKGVSYLLLFATLPGFDVARVFNVKVAQGFGVLYLLYYVCVGCFLSEGLERGWGLTRKIVTPPAIVSALATVGAFVAEFVGVRVVSSIKEYFYEAIQGLISIQKASGLGMNEIVLYVEGNADKLAFYMTYLSPSILFITVLFTVFINQLVGSAVTKGRYRSGIKINPYLDTFVLQDYIIWPFIAAGLVFFANAYLIHSDVIKFLSLNIAIVFAAIYFLNGLFVVLTLIKLIKTTWLRRFAYIFLMLSIQTLVPFIFIVGVGDLWIDFRRFVKTKIL